MSILVVNAGSRTLKLSLFDGEAKELLSGASYESEKASLSEFASKAPIEVVGHRFVHGGTKFRSPGQINEKVISELKEVSQLAPLHNPPSLKALQQAREAFPEAVHVAVFDTAFFSDLPERAVIYPLPYEWSQRWGIRRFGFHGINHQYCAMRAVEMVPSASRLIICHLGGGCSASAIRDGKPIATTMGFTPMEGLMMSTRSGSIDPGIMIHLVKKSGLTIEQIERSLNYESGLLGVSGVSADYRQIEDAAAKGNARAKLALDLFEDRVLSAIGSLSALLGGVDAIAFTGGIGENRAPLRSAVCRRLSWLGVQIDSERNEHGPPDLDIAAKESAVRVLAIRAREDLLIARAARAISALEHRRLS